MKKPDEKKVPTISRLAVKLKEDDENTYHKFSQGKVPSNLIETRIEAKRILLINSKKGK
jgi:hypothetical protein